MIERCIKNKKIKIKPIKVYCPFIKQLLLKTVNALAQSSK